jgi:hypothetical protein
MDLQLLHRFNSLAHYCYTTALVRGEHDILGVLMTIQGDDVSEGNVALALINLQSRASEQIIVFDGTGPESMFAVAMLLQYDPLSTRWVMAQLQSSEYMAMRTLTSAPNGEIHVSPLCLLDYDDAAETPGMNPPLALAVHDGTYSFIYPKPFDVHLTSPHIVKTDVTLQQAIWDDLKDDAIFTNIESADAHLPSASQGVFLPDNAFFDPSTSNAHQTVGVHIADQTVLAEAELSMIYMDQHIHLLVLCSPEHTVKVQKEPPSGEPHEGKQWRLWFTGWDNSWSKQHWTYAPDLGVPFPIDPAGYKYAWPAAYVAAIAGPTISLPSASAASVAVAFAIDMQKEIFSHAACLDENGNVVQICNAPVGLRPDLCCCGKMVVGVDLFGGNWRLWNWDVFQSQQFHRSIVLETSCQRAFIHAEFASERFWLVEELPERVRVTRRDALTLEKIASEVYLPGMCLGAEPQEHPLNGYHSVGLVPYEDSLLLLVNTIDSGELHLYQVH